MPASIDLTNKQFGKLTAIKVAYKENGHRMWECHCECGNKIYLAPYDLTSGGRTMCGECGYKSRATGGARAFPIYDVWAYMKRVSRKNKLTLYKKWKTLQGFMEDVQYQQGKYFVRINRKLGYFPGNVAWIDSTYPSRKKIVVNYRGRERILKDVVKERGAVSYDMVLVRLRWGWRITDAVEKPLHSRPLGRASNGKHRVLPDIKLSERFKRKE